MAKDDTAQGMAGQDRFVHGPRAVGALLPRITRPAFKRGNPAQAQILADWEVIVGPKVASMTVPRRLDRGVLTIGCSGPTAMHLHYEGIALINRINAHLGGQPVHSLKFTQAGMPPAAKDTRPVVPLAVAEAEAAVAGLPDGELKSALASLGRVVIGRGRQAGSRPKRYG